MRRNSVFAIALGMFVLGACSAPQEQSAPTDPPGRRLTLQEIVDPNIPFHTATGIDLGDAAPPSNLSFCEASALAPILWVDDRFALTQIWYDSFASASDIPGGARNDVDVLLEYANRHILYGLSGNDQPELNDSVLSSMKATANAAVEGCEELPLIVGQTPEFLAEPWYWNPAADEVADRCLSDFEYLTEGILAYVEQYGEQPRHLQQLGAGLYPSYFLTSDLFGVVLSDDGTAVPAAVPIGPCASL